uniref:Uncharacterized protein n=1 Tax=Pipistrellus kuhlii TaxID=59472 RepID=A0A7J7Y904_PIPKU|nr:hypothetical protein mPipKuh1_010267 [Pipistrellus kuhlii]
MGGCEASWHYDVATGRRLVGPKPQLLPAPQGASRTLGPHSNWLLSKLLHSRLLWETAVPPRDSHPLHTHCRGAARLGGLQIPFLNLSTPPFRKPSSSSHIACAMKQMYRCLFVFKRTFNSMSIQWVIQ